MRLKYIYRNARRGCSIECTIFYATTASIINFKTRPLKLTISRNALNLKSFQTDQRKRSNGCLRGSKLVSNAFDKNKVITNQEKFQNFSLLLPIQKKSAINPEIVQIDLRIIILEIL